MSDVQMEVVLQDGWTGRMGSRALESVKRGNSSAVLVPAGRQRAAIGRGTPVDTQFGGSWCETRKACTAAPALRWLLAGQAWVCERECIRGSESVFSDRFSAAECCKRVRGG